MSQDNKRQMNVECYSRDGFRLILPVMVGNPADVARELDFVRRAGLLHERLEKPDEYEVGRVVAVCKRVKADGTAHIAFYHENVKLEKRYVDVYLDTPKDIQDFEAATGLKVADLPAYDSDAHPSRDDSARSKKYIVPLAAPIMVKRRTEHFKDGEEWKSRHHLEAYLSKVSQQPPASQPSASQQSASQQKPIHPAGDKESSPVDDEQPSPPAPLPNAALGEGSQSPSSDGKFKAPDAWDAAAYTKFWSLVGEYKLNKEDVLHAVTGFKDGKLEHVQIEWAFEVLAALCLGLPMPVADIPF